MIEGIITGRHRKQKVVSGKDQDYDVTHLRCANAFGMVCIVRLLYPSVISYCETRGGDRCPVL